MFFMGKKRKNVKQMFKDFMRGCPRQNSKRNIHVLPHIGKADVLDAYKACNEINAHIVINQKKANLH